MTRRRRPPRSRRLDDDPGRVPASSSNALRRRLVRWARGAPDRGAAPSPRLVSDQGRSSGTSRTPVRAEVIDELQWHFGQARAQRGAVASNDAGRAFLPRPGGLLITELQGLFPGLEAGRQPGARRARIGRSRRCADRSRRPRRDPRTRSLVRSSFSLGLSRLRPSRRAEGGRGGGHSPKAGWPPSTFRVTPMHECHRRDGSHSPGAATACVWRCCRVECRSQRAA